MPGGDVPLARIQPRPISVGARRRFEGAGSGSNPFAIPAAFRKQGILRINQIDRFGADMTPQIARKEIAWPSPGLTPALASFGNAHRNNEARGARRALMLAAGDWRLEYRVLRCAKACFEEVYVLGAPGAEKLRLSLFCGMFFTLPGAFEEAGSVGAVRQINELCERHAIDYVLPGDAETTAFLASYGPLLLVPHYPVPPRDVFDRLNDKWQFAGVCSALKIPHPRTQYFASAEELVAGAARGRLSYPSVIKPLNMNAGKGVKKLDSASDIPATIKYAPMVVQTYVPGHDYCAFFLCQNGNISQAIGYLKNSKGIVFSNHANIIDCAQTIIRHYQYDGVIGFDIRLTEDGNFWFIECNPRFWIRMELAWIIGSNFIDIGKYGSSQYSHKTIPILSPRNLIKSLLKPWKLNRYEFDTLIYLASDPVFNTMLASADQSASAANFFE